MEEYNYSITEEEKNKTQKYSEGTSVYMVEFYFLFLIDFWRI